MTDLYACRGRVRSVEIVDAFLAPSGAERIAQRRHASFDPAGQLETEVVFGVSPGDSFGRIERTFRDGQCVVETTYGRDGALALRRETMLDSAGRPVEEVVEDAAGRRVGRKTIRHGEDGSRIEELQQAPGAGAHFQIAGVHFPAPNAAALELHYDQRALLRRVQFLGEDGASLGDVVIDSDAEDRRRSVEAAPAEELVYEDQVNEAEDWIERRGLERQDGQWIARRVIRRTIAYW